MSRGGIEACGELKTAHPNSAVAAKRKVYSLTQGGLRRGLDRRASVLSTACTASDLANVARTRASGLSCVVLAAQGCRGRLWRSCGAELGRVERYVDRRLSGRLSRRRQGGRRTLESCVLETLSASAVTRRANSIGRLSAGRRDRSPTKICIRASAAATIPPVLAF